MRKNIRSGEVEALLRLLDEPDELNFSNIHNKLISYGTDIIPHLEYSFEMNTNPLVQSRIDEMIGIILFSDLKNGFRKWAGRKDVDLLKGMILLAKISYPLLDESRLLQQIEELRRDTWLEMNPNLTMLEKTKVMNHVFFRMHGYHCEGITSEKPENLNISDILESKTGTSLSIGILYMIICRMLQLPVLGIDFPGNFLLAYVNGKGEDRISFLKENEVLFYINPFNKGSVFTRREIDEFLGKIKLKPRPEFYQPCDNRKIMNNLVSKMINAYKDDDRIDKLEKLKEIGRIITKDVREKQV